MVEPAPLRLTVDRFVAGGAALGRDGAGRVVFVDGAIPGETVDVEVVESRRDFARASVLQVVAPSPDRVVPPCTARRAGCGGCDWMHLDPGRQLDAKVAVVSDAVRRVARREPPPTTAGGSVPPTGYRTTVRVVGDVDGRASYRRGASSATVAADPCLVAHPRLREVLPGLRLAPDLEVTLRVSAATGAITAWWDGPDDAVVGLPPGTSTGPSAALVEHVAGRPLRVSARSFFQSGPAAAELLVAAVRRAAPELDRAGHVVDAYGGVGLFAVAAAPAATITLVESSRSAAADAEVNLAGRRARVVRAEVGRWRPAAGERVDVVVADPARPGLGAPGVAAVARSRAATVVLVSCDPASAARDLGLLAAEGYRADRMEVLDLFPGTHHVEVVTRFTRVPGGDDAR
ncbi:MAG: TRAM domain-containing protein [Ilumatobacteraceae bacterium]|nr:TRAM domain-containing protein [Ilumatobacteraceae bacterium]